MDEHLAQTMVYAGRLKEEEILLHSSSGGAFTALSDVFLESGSAVVCSSYNYGTRTLEYRIIESAEERDRARGSKYFQSIPGDIFSKTEEWLKQHPEKEILFVGMGCQAAGFIQFAEKRGFRDKITVVDIICHGSPSPQIWREYSDYIEKQNGTIRRITFKDKRNGWMNPTAVADTDNGEVSILEYVNLFYSCKLLRPSCHKCPYTTMERSTDITIGDFWHIEKAHPDFFNQNGTSLFLVHSRKGLELFERAKVNLDWIESSTASCWQERLERPTHADFERDRFWLDYEAKGFEYILSEYGTATFMKKVRRKTRKIISIIRK